MAAQLARDAAVAADPAAAIELVIHATEEPSASEPALIIAETLMREPGILAVIGHSNSAASLAASQIYNEAQVVQIAPTSTAPAYSQAGRYSFRMVQGDDEQGRFLARVVRDVYPDARRIAVVYVNDDYGRGLYRAMRRELVDQLVFERAYNLERDTAQLHAIARDVAKQRPDLLFWLGRAAALRITARALGRTMPDLRIIAGDAVDEPNIYLNRKEFIPSTRFVRFIDPLSRDSAMQDFRRRYGAATTQAFASEAALTYDAVRLVAAAVAAGARTGEEVRAYLMSLGRARPPYPGLAGPAEFNEHGDLLRGYLLAEIVDTGIVSIDAAAIRR